MQLKSQSTILVILPIIIVAFVLTIHGIEKECKSETQRIRSQKDQRIISLINHTRVLEKNLAEENCNRLELMIEHYDLNGRLLQKATS